MDRKNEYANSICPFHLVWCYDNSKQEHIDLYALEVLALLSMQSCFTLINFISQYPKENCEITRLIYRKIDLIVCFYSSLEKQMWNTCLHVFPIFTRT
jgi:hypothetical protein